MLKYILALLTICAAVAAVWFMPVPPRPLPAFGGVNSERATVLVHLSNGGHGSGVYIGEGRVLTAAHVAKSADNDRITVDPNDGDKGSVPAHVLWMDEQADVALLQLEEPLVGLFTAPLACGTPDAIIGDELEAIGNPLSFVNIHTFGRVAGVVMERGDEDGKQVNLIADMTIAPGNSGGPVFNKRGEIVGITVATSMAIVAFKFPSLIALTYIIPRSVICGLLVSPPTLNKEGTPTS